MVVLLVGGCFLVTGHSWRERAPLLGAVAVALMTLTPWLVWTRVNGVGNEADAFGADAFDPTHLWEQRNRLWPVVRELTAALLAPRGWFLAVPLLIVASVAMAIRERRFGWLGPPVLVVAGWGLFVWIYWAGSIELTFWLDTSAYRVVDSLALAAAIALPLVAERVFTSTTVSGAVLVGNVDNMLDAKPRYGSSR